MPIKFSRRGFLAAIAGALFLDPERALWVPGKKLISVGNIGIAEAAEIEITAEVLMILKNNLVMPLLVARKLEKYFVENAKIGASLSVPSPCGLVVA